MKYLPSDIVTFDYTIKHYFILNGNLIILTSIFYIIIKTKLYFTERDIQLLVFQNKICSQKKFRSINVTIKIKETKCDENIDVY